MSITHILGLLLTVSVAGNAWLGSSYLDARDKRTEAIGQRDQARSAAQTCSDATEALQAAAKTREQENKAAIAKAAAAAVARERRAQLQLATPATRPGDDCGSADDRFNNWLKARAK